MPFVKLVLPFKCLRDPQYYESQIPLVKDSVVITTMSTIV